MLQTVERPLSIVGQVCFLTIEVNMDNCLITHILQNIFFCVQQAKKEIQTGL